MKKERARIYDLQDKLLQVGQVPSAEHNKARLANTYKAQIEHLESLSHWDKATYIQELKRLNNFQDDLPTLIRDTEYNLSFVGNIDLEEINDDETSDNGMESGDGSCDSCDDIEDEGDEGAEGDEEKDDDDDDDEVMEEEMVIDGDSNSDDEN